MKELVHNSAKVRNIIFDLGGVILNIDYLLTSESFRKMGFTNFDELYSKARQSGLFDRFETGMITEAQFVAELNQLAGTQFPASLIIDAWNVMLLDFPLARLDMLERLRSKYGLYLLSNTNETHQRAFEKILFEAVGVRSLEPWFEKVYFSHQLQMRKPDPKIFQHVLTQHALKAEETLFIDDSPQHVEGAKSTGIRAVLLDNQPIEALINQLF